MAVERVRPLEKLPLKVKLAYSKLLALMLMTDKELDQLKLAALYRLMARIKITSVKRQEVLDSIFKGEMDLVALGQQCYEGLNQQEKNIVRFSLYKDLLIIMRANYIEIPEERLLLEKIEGFFDIKDEHKAFFEEELVQDNNFYDEDKEINCIDEAVSEITARATAIGIPLAAIYYNRYVGGFGAFGIVSGLHSIGKRVSKKHSLIAGLSVVISLGLISYNGTKWLLKYKDRSKCNIKRLMAEEILEIHQLAINYLEKDIAHIEDRVEAETLANNSSEDFTLQEIIFSLKKACAVLRNTKPVVI